MAIPICIIGNLIFNNKKKEIPKKIDKILFFKIGALGDILMTTPFVKAVRKGFPHATLDYACGKSYSNVLKGNKSINYLIEFDEKIFFENNIKELRTLARKLKENKYDIIFVLDQHWATGVFAYLADSFRIGFNRNGEGFENNLNVFYTQKKHDIDAYLDLGIYFKLDHHDKKMVLPITEKDRTFAKKLVYKNTVAVAPGGGVNTGQNGKIKIWPKENYLDIVDELSKKFNILLVGGKEDRKTSKWIYKHARSKKKIKDLCGRTNIRQTGAMLELCRFVICNDSGAMHIASCVNDNIVSLFGPTNPHVLAPLNKNSTFLWKEKQACRDIYGKFTKCDRDIMNKISVEEVLNATKKFR